MVIDRCPHCNVRHVQTTRQAQVPFAVDASTRVWTMERCQNPGCLKLVLVETDHTGGILRIYPTTSFEVDPAAPVSQEIRDDFREAGLSLGAGCFKASMVMSRRVLQRCLKEQGCVQRNLVDAINHAVDNGILRKAFHPVAEEIRQYGNLGAHPDDDQLGNANKENAETVLDFARLLIHEFFEVPAAAGRLKKSRTL